MGVGTGTGVEVGGSEWGLDGVQLLHVCAPHGGSVAAAARLWLLRDSDAAAQPVTRGGTALRGDALQGLPNSNPEHPVVVSVGLINGGSDDRRTTRAEAIRTHLRWNSLSSSAGADMGVHLYTQ